MSITKLYPNNAADKADNVLEQAIGRYKSVIIVGVRADDKHEIAATNDLSDRDIMAMLGQAQFWLFQRLE